MCNWEKVEIKVCAFPTLIFSHATYYFIDKLFYFSDIKHLNLMRALEIYKLPDSLFFSMSAELYFCYFTFFIQNLFPYRGAFKLDILRMKNTFFFFLIFCIVFFSVKKILFILRFACISNFICFIYLSKLNRKISFYAFYCINIIYYLLCCTHWGAQWLHLSKLSGKSCHLTEVHFLSFSIEDWPVIKADCNLTGCPFISFTK